MSGSHWGVSPRESVRRVCAARGTEAVIAGCIALLRGLEADAELIHALGGPPARWAIAGGRGGPDYWRRVWAARGLLYAYNSTAAPAIVEALGDEQWRVREMAAKVCARHRIDSAVPELTALADDPRVRVRRAAERAVIQITESK